MTTGSSGSIWRRFEHDPRDPAYATIRSSDRDRAVVHDVLGEAYADGRLDREEFDERSAQVAAAKTYADLVLPLGDLTADATVPARLSSAGQVDVRRSAQLYYGEKVRDAFFGFLVPNLICWVIWFLAGQGWPWPVFVSIPTGLNLLRVVTSRGHIIESRVEKLERRQAKALEPKKPGPEKEPDPDPPADTPDDD